MREIYRASLGRTLGPVIAVAITDYVIVGYVVVGMV
jgi:hypothetical protein